MSDAHVLVVDDDQRLRNLLQRYLAENGFRVTTADNAADARAKMRFVQPDLVVLDVMMPGETGLDLTESLRREKSDVPILLHIGTDFTFPASGLFDPGWTVNVSDFNEDGRADLLLLRRGAGHPVRPSRRTARCPAPRRPGRRTRPRDRSR